MGTKTSYSIENTYTVEDFITAGRMTTLSYDALAYKELLSNGNEICVLQVVDDYLPELQEKTARVKLSTDEYLKYRFKPKLLCKKVYGNGELYFIILLLNGIIDVKDFDFQVVRMLSSDGMNTLLSQIYNAEKNWRDKYNSDRGL